MRYITMMVWGLMFVCAFADAQASTYSIPVEKVNPQKVFFGKANAFDKPGNVNYEKVIKATPEYEEVVKKKVQPGTGRYWILLSQASDRAVRVISEVGQESGYDFIAAQGYLGSLEPPIPAEDITQLILNKLNTKKVDKKK
jgi:hypothetical protein